MLTLGSLFDGIGGFPYAGLQVGITPLWASEIEPFPIAVTKQRIPTMAHMGDITAMTGYTLPSVDVITGGSPCQNLSISGLRSGLDGEQSGLFMEQLRIVKEMRYADARRANVLIRPRYMVWENVTGTFSSKQGEDFRVILEEICRIVHSNLSVPRPSDRKWHAAGCIMGNQFSIAWRVLDAQHWGVPQRRKRIFLVADFGGQTAPKILFEQEGLCRPSSQSREADENTPARATPSSHMASSALTLCLNDQGGSFMNVSQNCTGTLRSQMGGHQPLIIDPDCCIYENHGGDARLRGPLPYSPTICARAGTGGNNLPLTMQPVDSYCIVGNAIDRSVSAGGNGYGYQENIAYTLTTSDRHAVYEPKDRCQEKLAYFVRRLTPLECERLQGFPDNWTNIKNAKDSPRYKALGNSVAIPCVIYVLGGIAFYLDKQRKENAHVYLP